MKYYLVSWRKTSTFGEQLGCSLVHAESEDQARTMMRYHGNKLGINTNLMVVDMVEVQNISNIGILAHWQG